VPTNTDQENSGLAQGDGNTASSVSNDAMDRVSGSRIRAVIGELYSEQFHILLYLTFFYYVLVTGRDLVSAAEGAAMLIAADFIILIMLVGIYFLERRGTINTGNVYLTPIPIAAAMVVNGYMHIFLSGDPLTLIKGILMTIAFGIVSLLPWIFWLLLSVSMAFFICTAIWMLGPESKAILVLGVGAAMISYGSFAMRYNSVRKQITLTLINEERAQKLEVLSKAKDRFIANVSHELRTPLTGLLGMVNLIDEHGLSAEQNQQLSAAKSSADALGSIIGDLLDVSRLDAGKLVLHMAPFDPASVVASVVAVMQSQVKDTVSLTLSLPSAGLTRLMGDESRIRQILFNLVGNAAKFTDQGAITLSIILQDQSESVQLRFIIEDTGVGIPQAKIAKLFDRFEQVDASTTRARAGTGLGLAIAQELATLMGSNIKVESVEGKGSRFWFDLTLQRAPELDADTRPSETAAKGKIAVDEILAQPLNILVAEDNPVNQLLIGKLLDRPSWRTRVVADGLAAVKAAGESPFDIILMDIQMPEMNGETATIAIKAGAGPNRNTPIIAVTANCQDSDIARYRDAGFSAYVGKPIMPSEFYSTLATLIENSCK